MFKTENKMNCSAMLTIFLILGCCHLTFGIKSHGLLKLVDNGYEGLRISISDQVPEEHCNQIITGLKNVLKEFSSALHIATDGRMFLRGAHIVIPNTWSTGSLSCSITQPVGTVAPSMDSHISITKSHPLFGNQPWTQQSQGCALPGDYINMGADLLRPTGNDSHVNTARLLLAEWAKFRWGVFEERGHQSDPLYPPFYRDPHTHHWQANGCFDRKVHSAEPECDPSTPGCKFTPKHYNNEHLSSSLLSFPELPTVKSFCNAETHNQMAPTKHNAQCGGRSAWEIIEQSQDFLASRIPRQNATKIPEPVISIAKEGKPKFILVVEDTASMNLQRRWEFLRKAVRRVVVYDIPDDSYIAIVSFNSVARTVSRLTYVDPATSDVRQKVGSSLPRNPSAVPESHKCILCGIQEGLRTIEEASVTTEGATLILVTSGAGTSTHQQMPEMKRLLEERTLKVMLVHYPITERHGSASLASSEELMPLIRVGAGGRSFTVMDEGVGNDSKVSMLMALMDALLSAVRLGGKPTTPGAPVLVHSNSYPGGIASMSTGSFALDDSVGPNARFSVFYYDINHVGNKIQLTTPSGNTPYTVQEEDGDVNMIFVQLDNAERGLWSYTVENRADSHQGLYVQVSAKRNTSSGLGVRLWSSSGALPINASDPSNPVILYAEVLDSGAAVLNAKVMARLQRLGTNATGSFYDPIYVELRDNGNGDPDITEGDGVYSRYLPNLHRLPGKYVLSAQVDYNNGMALIAKESPTRHHKSAHYGYYFHQYDSQSTDRKCCGSTLLSTHSRRAPPFQHHVTWGVLDIIHPPSPIDVTPPSRVLDLEIDVNSTVYEVTLKWTAPGDDFDFGRAQKYEAVVAPSWRQARDFQGNELAGLPKPLPSGSHHKTTLRFTRYEELWYISMRAVDESGNIGTVGNIATLWIPRPPTTYEITTRTQPGLTTSGNVTTVSQELGATRHIGMTEFRLELLTLILGAAGGLLLVIVLISVYCLLNSRRRRKKQQKDAEKMRSGNVMVKSGSCQGGLDESVDSVEGIKETDAVPGTRSLSPVQSWGATTLLKEHERRLSVNSCLRDIMTNEDGMIAYQPDGNVMTYPPDVTVTNHPDCHATSPTHPMGLDPPPYDPPPYSTYPVDEDQCPCVPGPEYNGYANGWDDPMSGHLISRSHNATPSVQGSVSIADRKRRNVTQV